MQQIMKRSTKFLVTLSGPIFPRLDRPKDSSWFFELYQSRQLLRYHNLRQKTQTEINTAATVTEQAAKTKNTQNTDQSNSRKGRSAKCQTYALSHD